MEIFDAIVIGLGAMGSATAYQLAQRGKSVLGLEAFTMAHDQGSSHGSSRIIRQAYYEDPAYVPLLLRSYELWQRLQTDTKSDLLHITGGLYLGLPNSEMVAGSLRSAADHRLEYEVLDAAAIRDRFPQFVPSRGEVAFFEKNAGYLRPEECIRQNLAQASRYGAQLRLEEPMILWMADGSGEGVTVKSSRQTYHARSLVLSTGAWAPKILSLLNLPLSVYRRVMFWFDPIGGMDAFSPDKFPIYLWEPEGAALFYGFPASEGRHGGVKVALHVGNEPCSPESIDRSIRQDDESEIRSVIASRIPALNGPLVKALTCMYTMTPDAHFIIDRHPEYPQVSIAAGFSGHGFKFSSVVGEILADLATEGSTNHNVALFSSQRFQSLKGTAGAQD
jgi:sarcosine oxidase